MLKLGVGIRDRASRLPLSGSIQIQSMLSDSPQMESGLPLEAVMVHLKSGT